MKIAVITSSYPRFPGDGAAPFIKSLAEGYAKLGHTVYVIAPHDPQVIDGELNNLVQIRRYKYIWPQSLSKMGHGQSLKGDAKLSGLSLILVPLFLVFGFLCLYRVCKKANIDIIHVNWVLPNGPIAYCVSKLLKIPYIMSLHGSDIFVSNKNIVFSKIARIIINSATSITACSQELMDSTIKLGGEGKILLLPWGADPEIFSPIFYSGELREKFLIKENEILVLAIGRMVYKKGFDVLLSAWEKIITKFPYAKLIVGGDGPLKIVLEQQAKILGIESTVKFIGRIDWREMPAYLATADIFVLPSIKDKYGNVDGLPTILLEAMSCGTACVASDIGGVPLVIKKWENGVLFPEKSINELADVLFLLFKNDIIRSELGLGARKSIEDRFNWENVSSQIIELFNNAIGLESK